MSEKVDTSNNVIDDDFVEHLCRESPTDQFSDEVQKLNYLSLIKLHTALEDKASDIRLQLSSRSDSNIEWKKRAEIALSFNKHKTGIVTARINRIRVNSAESIVKQLGGKIETIKSKRLLIIKCLINIFEKYLDTSGVNITERAIIDLGRSLSEDSDKIRFGDPFFYDLQTNKIISNSGKDIAYISDNEFKKEEYGILFSLSSLMLRRLRTVLYVFGKIEESGQLDNKTDELVSQVCNDIKSIISEFP